MRRRAFLCATVVASIGVPAVARAQANPHAGAPPGGRGHGGAAGYQPPEDVVAPNQQIPAGSVIVRIVDAEEQPMPNTEVELSILHQSVAQGDTRESKTGTTNEDGFVEFEDLQVGSGHAYQAKTTHQGATFQSNAFGLTRDAGGVAVILHVFEVATELTDTMVFTPDARAFLSLKDDVIVVQYEALLANPSPIAWLADYSIVMPPGFKAFTGEDDAVPATIASETSVRLKGTVRPGGAIVRFRFHVPHHNEPNVDIPLALPPRTTRILVAAEASKKMGLTADGFPKEAERVRDRGRTLLKLEKQWTPRDGESFLTKANIHLTGLPTRGIIPWIAAALAGATATGAVAYALTRNPKSGVLAADTREDLLEAKEAMLGEIVALERAHQRGEIGPRSYDRLRKAMLDALARIVDKLEASPALPAPAPAVPPKKVAAAAASEPDAADRRPAKKRRQRPAEGGAPEEGKKEA